MKSLREAIVNSSADNFIIHKIDEQVYIFPVTNPESAELYQVLHNGRHYDIIDKIIRYGQFLLDEKLSKQEHPALPDLKIVEK